MSIFLTGISTSAAHPDVEQASRCAGVVPMWVNIEERGRCLPGGVFPPQSQFETLIYVLDLTSLGSTQMAGHFFETEIKIRANEKLVFPIAGALTKPQHEQLIPALKHYRRIGPAELLAICRQADSHPGP